MGLEKARRYLGSQTLVLLVGLYENFVKQEIIYIYRLRVHSKSMHLQFSFGAHVPCQQVQCLSYSEFCIPLCNSFLCFCFAGKHMEKYIYVYVYISIQIYREHLAKRAMNYAETVMALGQAHGIQCVSVPYSGRDPECLSKASKSSYTRPRIIRDCSGTHKSWLLFLLFLFPHCFHL